MGRRFRDEINSTRQINPADYAYKISGDRLSSFAYAVAGFGYMFRWQRNVRILSLITPLVMFVGFWLGITRVEWIMLILMICMVWMAEFLNAGIEAAIDLAANREQHPMAKVGKDVAAAAVLLVSICSVIVGLLIFLEPLLDKLGA